MGTDRQNMVNNWLTLHQLSSSTAPVCSPVVNSQRLVERFNESALCLGDATLIGAPNEPQIARGIIREQLEDCGFGERIFLG